ncbi:receptor-like protein EIX1 [Magnolia sinica]|uniref:receptor-like protein EIX1 n=1 Tax=Magnolia sinica TaxID=86752 RepID=UPI002658AD35|nr:receptor-like protein EIX1 [Magnolia sinica]
MERRGFLVSLFLLKVLLYSGGYSKVSSCLDSERKALTTFRKALNDPSNLLSSWDDEDSDCCKWRGITCHNIAGYVLKLDLRSFSGPSLSAGIDPALVELKHLQLLDLSYNDFNGAPFPQLLGSMKELRHLHLSDAGFSGRIPHQLGNLSKLISLQLSSYSNNYLSAKNLWWLTSLPSLKYLDLSYVNLSMISPTLASINFTSLRLLDLAANNFNSTIPNWIANISSLVSLHLASNNFHGNQISGKIPSSMEGMKSLIVLDLSGNNINGIIPLRLGNCVELKAIDLSKNMLSSGIPNSLGLLCQLQTMHMSNNSLSGKLPSSLKKCTSLETLDLGYNNFSGGIPTWISKSFPALRFLSLRSKMFTSNIPPQ